MVIEVCADPDILRVMKFVNILLTFVKIIIPLAIIVISSMDTLKLVLSGDVEDARKIVAKFARRLISAVIIFTVPTFVTSFLDDIGPNLNAMSCFTNATDENIKIALIKRAEIKVSEAEADLTSSKLYIAEFAVRELSEGSIKNNYLSRLENVKKTIDDKNKRVAQIEAKTSKESTGNASSTGKLAVVGSYASTGKGKASVGYALSSEPDPSAAINYWSKMLNPSDFIYPRDEATGLPLGAWPKNYKSIGTQLTNMKTYSGKFIFPITPENGNYHFVYQHNGIDIMATLGTPVYSPADATLVYSEWGHTANLGGDETAYSVTLKLPSAVNINGTKIDTIFMTHMSGIRYRCSWGACNRKVKKGELLGFSGTAAGSSSSIGYAAHLHMTFYPESNYSQGLVTTRMEELYNIPTQTSSYSIKAGS